MKSPRKISRGTSTLLLAWLLVTVGCARLDEPSRPAAVPEIAPGILQGYLASESLPDSLALIPPPPAEGSAAFARDEEAGRKGLAQRGTPRWDQAVKDAELAFPAAADAFTEALSFKVTEAGTPHLYMVLRRTLADAGLSTYRAKNHYARARPFMRNNEPICTPEDEEALRKDGSYPSGHTAIGWAWALILCEVVPEHTDAILARGREFGRSRMVCNVHWQSDVDEGRIMGAAAVARLHADEGFRRELEEARREVAAIRGRVGTSSDGE